MIRLIEQVLPGRTAVLAPAREGTPFLRRQAAGDLGIQVAHRLARTLLGCALLVLGRDERLPVERLGDQGLNRLLACSAYLTAEWAQMLTLGLDLIQQGLTPIRGKGAGIAEQIGRDACHR